MLHAPSPTELALAVVVLLAFSIEAALGFGATLVAVALGSFFVGLDVLLPALVPLNVLLSGFLVARYWRAVETRFLFTRLLPLMAVGLPLGQLAFQTIDASILKRIFGAFVAVVAAIELRRMRLHANEAPVPLRRPVEVAFLLLGGVVHGAFATGGPMAVYVTGRVVHDKGAYRATLSVLWLALNLVLVGSYGVSGALGPETLSLSVVLAPSLLLGLVVGELAHHRVPVATFRAGVFAMLLLAGGMLLVRG